MVYSLDLSQKYFKFINELSYGSSFVMKKLVKPFTAYYFALLYLVTVPHSLYAFDHQHSLWNSILQQNVHMSANKQTSHVDYANIQKTAFQLGDYLKRLSAIDKIEFNQWSKGEQKAFLINAYNAFTIQLILTRYPDIISIKDIGSFFSNPWKKKFFNLLGGPRSLDELEHKILRKEGIYDDPYIHVALVCASISCPALINEAYTAEKIEQQLHNSMLNFLSDKERNRFNSKLKILEVSKIFDWYENDFTKGYRDIYSLNDLFSKYYQALSDNKDIQKKIQSKRIKIDYLEYDWHLNDLKK